MPVNNFTVGRDLSFSLVTPNGTLDIAGLTDYEPKPMFTDLKHKGLSGNVEHAEIPDGWQITIKLDRRDQVIDDYFAAREADYFAGVNVKGGIILETITEKDGSVSQYRYTNVVLKFETAGPYRGDAYIPLSLTAMASRRIKVA